MKQTREYKDAWNDWYRHGVAAFDALEKRDRLRKELEAAEETLKRIQDEDEELYRRLESLRGASDEQRT